MVALIFQRQHLCFCDQRRQNLNNNNVVYVILKLKCVSFFISIIPKNDIVKLYRR